MRVLLDECVPQRLRHHIVGHEVHTVPDMGWASNVLPGLKAGEVRRIGG